MEDSEFAKAILKQKSKYKDSGARSDKKKQVYKNKLKEKLKNKDYISRNESIKIQKEVDDKY